MPACATPLTGQHRNERTLHSLRGSSGNSDPSVGTFAAASVTPQCMGT